MRSSDTRERIRRYLLERHAIGEPPTVREIGEALGLRSPATVYQHLKKLEQKGIIASSGAGRSRGWRFVDPTDVMLASGDTIPVIGRLAPGQPFDSLVTALPPLRISPAAFASRASQVVALRVDGNRWSESGLLAGDYAIIRRQGRPLHGDVVAVQIGGEGDLRRWVESGARGTLDPASKRFKPIPRRQGAPVDVFGKLVGTVRFG